MSFHPWVQTTLAHRGETWAVQDMSSEYTGVIGVSGLERYIYIGPHGNGTVIDTFPDTPWDWHICLHWGGARGVNVGIWQSHGVFGIGVVDLGSFLGSRYVNSPVPWECVGTAVTSFEQWSS